MKAGSGYRERGRRTHLTRVLALALALTLPALAGCVATGGAANEAADPASASGNATVTPRVVLGFSDSGINPYHVDFRDDGPDAYRHPSTYIPGYPEDAIALNLTLDAPDLETALEADKAVWESVEPGKLYWFPGTRIVGGFDAQDVCADRPTFPFAPPQEACYPILDLNGHGTMVASRGAGNTHSLCSECKIVMVQRFGSGTEWLAEQPWVDAQSNSWGSMPPTPSAVSHYNALAAAKPTFFAAGNGAASFLGGAGHPTQAGTTTGGANNILVGGHDNGRVTAWTGSMPQIVADACYSWAAHHDSMDKMTDSRGGGTSGASPYAAGAGAQMILEARRLLGDAHVGVREGADGAVVLAQGDASGIAGGPLADGDFTLTEFKDVLFHTADPRPERTEDDGAECSLTEQGPAYALYGTLPVEWRTIPEGVPQYYFVGYGGVNVDTLASALDVLRGEAPVPDRPMEDAWFEKDQAVRRALYGDE